MIINKLIVILQVNKSNFSKPDNLGNKKIISQKGYGVHINTICKNKSNKRIMKNT